MTGDIAQMGAYIGAGLACIGMGFAAMGVGMIVGKFLQASTLVKGANAQTGNMFVGIAFAEALGIFAFLVSLLLMFAV
jgi:F-type H+-transporting ATPase subunit c